MLGRLGEFKVLLSLKIDFRRRSNWGFWACAGASVQRKGKRKRLGSLFDMFAACMLRVCALPHAPVCIRSRERALALPRSHGAPSEHIPSLDSSRKM